MNPKVCVTTPSTSNVKRFDVFIKYEIDKRDQSELKGTGGLPRDTVPTLHMLTNFQPGMPFGYVAIKETISDNKIMLNICLQYYSKGFSIY